jgi:hypothetical protein
MLEVTKEEEAMVANLPDIVRTERESSDESSGTPKEHQRKWEFKAISDVAVAEMYESIVDTAQTEPKPQNEQSGQNEEKREDEDEEDAESVGENEDDCGYPHNSESNVEATMVKEGNTVEANKCEGGAEKLGDGWQMDDAANCGDSAENGGNRGNKVNNAEDPTRKEP